MIARKTRLSRYLRKVQGQIVVVIDKTARAAKPFVNIRAGRFRLTQSSFSHFSTQRLAGLRYKPSRRLVGASEILLRDWQKWKRNDRSVCKYSMIFGGGSVKILNSHETHFSNLRW